MEREEPYISLGWRNAIWDLVRYYCSIRGTRRRELWLSDLKASLSMSIDDGPRLVLPEQDVDNFFRYLTFRKHKLEEAFTLLRTEEEALAYCSTHRVQVGTTSTKSQDHHQSSKALIAAVSQIAEVVSRDRGLSANLDPQTRCVWCQPPHLHVTARNLDGAIPSLANPVVVWEIKEYWGKTKGGSKMSDAVYECNLVGQDLRDFEDRGGPGAQHVVFVDGKEQWSHRRSDLARFIDLLQQGLIDYLFIGREVETDWEPTLRRILS